MSYNLDSALVAENLQEENGVTDTHQEAKSRNWVDKASFVVALLAMLVAGWGSLEAHRARIESKSAIEAAERSAAAAEKSNSLAARSQSSYLIPSIRRSNDMAAVTVKNVSSNIALDVRAGYFLYTGPLKSVNDVSNKLAGMALRPLTLALAASAETTVIDSLVSASGTRDLTATFSIPVVRVDSGTPLVPRLEMQTETIKLGTIPIETLVIGLVSFEDGLNRQHRATFCFSLNGAIEDQECSKLNSLQLEQSGNDKE